MQPFIDTSIEPNIVDFVSDTGVSYRVQLHAGNIRSTYMRLGEYSKVPLGLITCASTEPKDLFKHIQKLGN